MSPTTHWSTTLSERISKMSLTKLAKRIDISLTGKSTLEEIEAARQDPWVESSKYALGWVYFSVALLVFTFFIHLYHLWGDKIRTALHKEDQINGKLASPQSDYELVTPNTVNSFRGFFPAEGPLPSEPKQDSSVSTISWLNYTIAFTRWIFYRPIPVIRVRKLEIVPPSLAAAVIVLMALIFVVLLVFIPQPLFYESIRVGSPPLAIRAGMLAVSMLPWIIALSTKANLISIITGIGHERLNVLHRWGGYLCLFLALVHTIPFYITPVWNDGALEIFRQFIKEDYIYASGLAALVPLGVLCIHSLPFLRNRMYELFVTLHIPVSIVFLGTMFWHCKNFLTSWHYLYSTAAIWVLTYLFRLIYLNWTNPFHISWLIGEESAVTILPENAVKVTIPTRMKWRPGQYVYLRMPGISIFGNHPFTIASLCSDDFPSSYGEDYRDMTLVFRPFSGFTGKVLDTALRKGPYKTYRAFIDGPYGGMRREMASFDHVIFFAGGSGITAIASQLLDLIKRMRDDKARTKTIKVIWALKRPETMEWFKEELRICREYAPPGAVFCQFYLTASKRYAKSQISRSRPSSGIFHDRLNGVFQGVVGKRDSAFIQEEAAGDKNKERELRLENEDSISALPPAHVAQPRLPIDQYQSTMLTQRPQQQQQQQTQDNQDYFNNPDVEDNNNMNFGFPSTPTMLQKNLMRFAFFPSQKGDGWGTEYGRPDIPFMLKQFSRDFGKRTCVFVCGPPSMRVDVANSVARLQSVVMADPTKDELFLHTENYSI